MKPSSNRCNARERPSASKPLRLARLKPHVALERSEVAEDVTPDLNEEASVVVSETDMRAAKVVTFLKLAATWERSPLLLPRVKKRRLSNLSPRLFKRSPPLSLWVTSILP